MEAINNCKDCGNSYNPKTKDILFRKPDYHFYHKSICITKGYIQCKCGWKSKSAKTEAEIIHNWNLIMSRNNVLDFLV